MGKGDWYRREQRALHVVPLPAKHELGAWKGLWSGTTVFVLASGPSLTMEDVVAVRGYSAKYPCPVIVTNTTYRLAPWANLLFFYDRQWWRVHGTEVLETFHGQIVTMSHLNHPRVLSLAGQRVNSYRNSGGGAISFALHAGARRIVVLGLDGQHAPDGRRHWHDQDPRLGDAAGMSRFLPQFPLLAQAAASLGAQVLNASRATAITCFPRVALEDILTTDFIED